MGGFVADTEQVVNLYGDDAIKSAAVAVVEVHAWAENIWNATEAPPAVICGELTATWGVVEAICGLPEPHPGAVVNTE